MSRVATSLVVVSFLALGLWGGEVAAQSQPDGQLTMAFDASIAPAPYEDMRLKKP